MPFRICGLLGLLLLGCAACTPEFQLGQVQPAAHPAPDWLEGVKGDDVYIRVQAETDLRAGSPDAGVPNLCSLNLFKRWISRDGQSVVLVGLNGEADTPVLTNIVDDGSQTCTTLLQTHPVGPAILVPGNDFTATPVSIEIRVASRQNTTVDIARMVSDGILVAGAVTGAGTVPALVTVATISEAVSPLARQVIDDQVQGMETVVQPVDIDLESIQSKRLVYSAPVTLPGAAQPFADLVIRVDVIPSIFQALSATNDPTGATIPLDLSQHNWQTILDDATVYDPLAVSFDGTGFGNVVSIQKWFVARYPGSSSAIALVTSILNSSDATAAASALISFCGEVKDLRNSGILPLTERDKVILVWAMLSPTAAWHNPVLFPPQGNECLDAASYATLRSVKLSLPDGAVAVP